MWVWVWVCEREKERERERERETVVNIAGFFNFNKQIPMFL